MKLGKRIKYYRKKKNFTQQELADQSEIDRENISKYENDNATPILETLLKICDALQVTPNDILMDEFDMPEAVLCDEIARLISDFLPSEHRKLIDYISYIKSTR